jgi:hypothetical protein
LPIFREDCRAYPFGHDGHFSDCQARSCDEDRAAIEWARQLVTRYAIEICCGERCCQAGAEAGTIIETNLGLRRPTLNQDARFMAHKNERVELEMKIMKYRALARQAGDDVTRARIKELVAELERKLREIDE